MGGRRAGRAQCSRAFVKQVKELISTERESQAPAPGDLGSDLSATSYLVCEPGQVAPQWCGHRINALCVRNLDFIPRARGRCCRIVSRRATWSDLGVVSAVCRIGLVTGAKLETVGKLLQGSSCFHELHCGVAGR